MKKRSPPAFLLQVEEETKLQFSQQVLLSDEELFVKPVQDAQVT